MGVRSLGTGTCSVGAKRKNAGGRPSEPYGQRLVVALARMTESDNRRTDTGAHERPQRGLVIGPERCVGPATSAYWFRLWGLASERGRRDAQGSETRAPYPLPKDITGLL